MIIEQIRYYVAEEHRDHILEVRRTVSRMRSELGLPAGHILIADPAPDEGPLVIWQCGYEDEAQMALAEATLAANASYTAVRNQLGDIVTRVELELYMADEGDEPS